MKHPEYMSITRLSNHLGVTKNAIRNWVKKGLVEAFRPPGSYTVVRVASAKTLIEQNSVTPDLDKLLRKIGLAA